MTSEVKFEVRPEKNILILPSLYISGKHVLKSKEITCTSKCNKNLKKKLKKYKLRRNGIEDEDVLNISKTLVSSLTVKSPNQDKVYHSIKKFDEVRPKNYLFKMIRKKIVDKSIDVKEQNCEKIIDENVCTEGPNNVVKTQTNAFKLLMDSRNKSIGSNSPGKDRDIFEDEMQHRIEKNEIKAKRHLILQKMAESKGALKSKILEDNKDKEIQRKMIKRAENLKTMLMNQDTKLLEKTVDMDKKINIDKSKTLHNVNVKQTKPLQLVDIFEDSKIYSSKTKTIKKISIEDENFLKKLAPSIKKKENMLCYFNKLDKSSEEFIENNDSKPVIKVKINKGNKKRKRLSLRKKHKNYKIEKQFDQDSEIPLQSEDDSSTSDQLTADNTDKSLKRKRTIAMNITTTDKVHNNAETNLNELRPKRSVKKPVKYAEDTYMLSSDEELHIFTPKKKKRNNVKVTTEALPDIDRKKYNNVVAQSILSTNTHEKKNIKSENESYVERSLNSVQNKILKLAPIFTVKTPSEIATIEAKQKFLHSGIPNKLKKLSSGKGNNNCLLNNFPTVVHVQQILNIDLKYMIKSNLLEFIQNEELNTTQLNNYSYKYFLNLKENTSTININLNMNNIQTMLQNLKDHYPHFPVYRTFRILSEKCQGEIKDLNYSNLDNSIELINNMTVEIINDSPDRLVWTDKFKATSSNHIIGNFDSVKELKKWLLLWKENKLKTKMKCKDESDSSDFYQSDTDSKDSMTLLNNLLILTGPSGSGKTSSIYAVASELAIKVIEVNASNKRTGKIMLQDLQEATKSHKVNRGTSSAENSQKFQNSQEIYNTNKNKKKQRGRPKKNFKNKSKVSGISKFPQQDIPDTSTTQEMGRTGMSLILIDDADIIFDQDDGFCSAIGQILQSSKRPVILVTTSLTCPHLQKFIHSAKILKMRPLIPSMLGTWLDIMCLADHSMCWPGSGKKFLDFFKGDIRKAINCLHFYVFTCNTSKKIASQSGDSCKPNIDLDENSSISWADHDPSSERQNVDCTNDERFGVWLPFSEIHSNLLHLRFSQVFNVWWSLPDLLKSEHKIEDSTEIFKSTNKSTKSKTIMDIVASTVDAFSVIDYCNHYRECTDVTTQPWHSAATDSVSESENFEDYFKYKEVGDEIGYYLVSKSIVSAQAMLGCNFNHDLSFPGMTVQRKKSSVIAKHNDLTAFLNCSAVLDRRALALDYWSGCRTICRIEKSKTNNSKRNNRFCHYLKSVNVLCKNDSLDNLGRSFSSDSDFNTLL